MYSALGTLYRRRGDARAADQKLRLRPSLREGPPGVAARPGAPRARPGQRRRRCRTAAASLKKLLDADPPPSPRQLAVAHLARALLVARVAGRMPGSRRPIARKLAEATGVPLERAAATALAAKEDEEGFALDRNNPELHLLRGKRLLVEGQPDAAIREMREAVKADPSRAQAYVDLARALMQKPEGARDAQEALTTAIRTMGESPRLMVMLGQVYFRQGRLDEAAAQYTKALADGKTKNPEARLQLGVVYREKKDYPKSVEQLTRASQEFIGQSSRIAESLTELGRTYELQGDRTRADEAFRRALDADPSDAGHLLLLRPVPRRRTGGAARRPGSPRRSTSSSTRAASTPPTPRPSPAEDGRRARARFRRRPPGCEGLSMVVGAPVRASAGVPSGLRGGQTLNVGAEANPRPGPAFRERNRRRALKRAPGTGNRGPRR